MQKDGIRECGTIYSYPYFLSFIILIAFTVMNLSIAAIIDGLKSAKKDEEFVITGRQIDELVEAWSEYDPQATGWISVESLAFLIYELPPPIGIGKVFPDERIPNEHTFHNRIRDNIVESKIYGKMLEKRSTDNDETVFHHYEEGMKYIIHKKKRMFMKETKMMQILGKFSIPVYTNTKVHFKDICKQIIKNIFESKKMEVQFNPKIEKRIKSKWNKKYKSLKKQKDAKLNSADQFMAGMMILRWVRKAKLRLRAKKLQQEDEPIIKKRAYRKSIAQATRKQSKTSFRLSVQEKALSEYDDVFIPKSGSVHQEDLPIIQESKFSLKNEDLPEFKDESFNSSKDLVQADKKSRKSKDFRESYNRVKSFFSQEENKEVVDQAWIPKPDQRTHIKLNNKAQSSVQKHLDSKIVPFQDKFYSNSPGIKEQNWFNETESNKASLKESSHSKNSESELKVSQKKNNFIL